MSEPTGCSWCSEDVHLHGLSRHLQWDHEEHAFCSFLHEFFWRRERFAEFRETVALSFISRAPGCEVLNLQTLDT
jgi:hypothetical protein